MEDDTIKLLRECNSGIKMGTKSLDDVLNHVKDTELFNILKKSKDKHSKLGNETHKYLEKFNDEGKEPTPIAKVMATVKSNMKIGTSDTDNTIADLITDGCNMGVKSLYKYLNKYKASDESIKNLVKRVIKEEEDLARALRIYL